jgi:hypothetical protein
LLLLTDGYAAYERYAAQSDNVIHAQCWIHTRRYFDQAQKAEPEASEQVLEIIGQLYIYEKKSSKTANGKKVTIPNGQ